MAYSKGPYAYFPSLPVPPIPEVHSARKYNFKLSKLEVDETTGGFLGMPPNTQRVALLISFEVEDSSFITPQGNSRVKQQIQEALRPLTSGRAPLIRVERIEVGRTSAGETFRRVDFVDLTKNDSNVVQTVQLT